MRTWGKWQRTLLVASWLGSIVFAVAGSMTQASPTAPAFAQQLEDEQLRFFRKSQQTQAELIDVLREIRNELQSIGQCACKDR